MLIRAIAVPSGREAIRREKALHAVLRAWADASRSDLEKELRQVTADHKKLVDAIIAGVPAEQVKDRVIELDARRKELERDVVSAPAPDPVRFHPSIAKTYRDRVGQLIRSLSDPEGAEKAKEALRALVEKDRAGAGAGRGRQDDAGDRPARRAGGPALLGPRRTDAQSGWRHKCESGLK